MINLVLTREPYWLDLGHGVRVRVQPCTTALMMAARSELPTSDEPGARPAALVKALGRLAIKQWEGVGDDVGDAVSVSPAGVDALLDLWPMAEAFERLYIGPALLLDDEKNGSRPSADGTSAAGLDTVAVAQA